MSERSQTFVVWWALAMTATYGLVLGFLFHMIPPPSPSLGAQAVADFYRTHSTEIRIGATICGWVSAFMLPLSTVIATQMRREEKGRIWSNLTLVGGALMSLFLVLPTIFWGVAAFTPTRPPEITLLMHELGMLTLVTTDQFYVFMWVAVAVICFKTSNVRHSAFPRWFGYLTAWIAIMFEAGAISFIPRAGAFAWDGLFVFWFPLTLFGVWIAAQAFLLLRALKGQRLESAQAPVSVASTGPAGLSPVAGQA
ncbi:hypothetical protein [Amycolatopsis acidicola]|uniref:hypothetical protein n=1 Tax=Amycolatopsis acidicola TaxID=2596893 RepID=UPI001AA04D43|nr:hypothetical protein [Amycolatopsis acidicola]